jgi:hypothetical protein
LQAALARKRGGQNQNPLVEYILVSQPHEGSVSVTEVNALTRKVVNEARVIISSGLREPSGLAVDHSRQRLYVADPKSHKVFMYNIFFGDKGLSVDETQQHVAVRDIKPRWVAVDERGSLFCTDEGRNFVSEVPIEDLQKLGIADDVDEEVKLHLRKVYSGDKTRQVDHPGGIAVEGGEVFWGNRDRHHRYGTLLSAPEDPDSRRARGVPEMIQALSNNMDKVYGVCASPNIVFYTGGSRSVYGAKPGSNQAKPLETVFLDDYASPRGCVWDGDGTMYVADKGGDSVWSFPSSLHGGGIIQATKLLKVDDPYGVAVFRPSLTMDAVGFLRGGASKVAPALALVPLVLLAMLGWSM